MKIRFRIFADLSSTGGGPDRPVRVTVQGNGKSVTAHVEESKNGQWGKHARWEPIDGRTRTTTLKLALFKVAQLHKGIAKTMGTISDGTLIACENGNDRILVLPPFASSTSELARQDENRCYWTVHRQARLAPCSNWFDTDEHDDALLEEAIIRQSDILQKVGKALGFGEFKSATVLERNLSRRNSR